MISDLPRLMQTAGSNDCLPTAVRAVLLRHQYRLSPEEANYICRTTAAGTGWYNLIEGLRERFDVQDLSDDWDRIVDSLESDEEPVIVRIGLLTQDPIGGRSVEGHAVVIRAVDENRIIYMDPLYGTDEVLAANAFQKAWNLGGSLACTVRPA